MAQLDDILATLDDDEAAIVRQALADKETAAQEAAKQAALTQRKLRFNTDKELAEKFPRIVKAIREGLISSDGVDEDGLEAFLTAEEDRLAKLGVPVSTEPATPPQPNTPQQATEAEPPTGAAGWGAPVAPTSGSTEPTGEHNVIEAIESGSISDILSAIHFNADRDPRFRGANAFSETTKKYQDTRPLRTG